MYSISKTSEEVGFTAYPMFDHPHCFIKLEIKIKFWLTRIGNSCNWNNALTSTVATGQEFVTWSLPICPWIIFIIIIIKFYLYWSIIDVWNCKINGFFFRETNTHSQTHKSGKGKQSKALQETVYKLNMIREQVSCTVRKRKGRSWLELQEKVTWRWQDRNLVSGRLIAGKEIFSSLISFFREAAFSEYCE